MAEASVNQDSLTLEETNKVRVSLGLKPIGAEPEADAEPDADEVAENNFAQRRAEAKAARAEREMKEKIDKAKNQRALKAQLKGSTLGDAGKDDSMDAKAFAKVLAKRAKKREKELAERRRREMEEADALAYGEEDLAGLKVAHGADDFETGEDIILTLKDSKVLDGDEDELQNVNLADYDKDKAAKERKRKAAATYTGYDDEEFEEGRIGQKAEVLSKYDGDFDGGKVSTEGFRLGAPVEKKPKIEEETDIIMHGAPAQQRVHLSADFTREWEVSDYMKEGDPGFKKPKKRRAKKSTRKAENDEDEMDVDPTPTFTKRVVGDTPENLVDDDDLQAALARSRRQNAKKKPKVKPEDLAAQIAEQRKVEEATVKEEPEEDDGRIMFDETSEFVRNVTTESRAAPVKQERARTRTVSPARAVKTETSANGTASPTAPVVVKIERGEDVEMEEAEEEEEEDEDEQLAEMAAREGLSLAEYRLKIDSQMQELSEMAAADPDAPEPTIGQGLGGALALLRNSGALEKRTEQQIEREKLQKQHDLWLADHRRRAAERELERIAARGGNRDQAQREYDNRMREQKEAREALDAFKSYKPDVNIVYHDEFGRQMTVKEAWKSLSHKFHGKTSGRMKTEKRLKKIDQERKEQSMGASDTPFGMGNAFARRQQKTGEAHMVLSVGNKGSVQSDNKLKKR